MSNHLSTILEITNKVVLLIMENHPEYTNIAARQTFIKDRGEWQLDFVYDSGLYIRKSISVFELDSLIYLEGFIEFNANFMYESLSNGIAEYQEELKTRRRLTGYANCNT